MPADPAPLNTPWSVSTSPELLDDLVEENVQSDNAPGSYVRLSPGTPHPDQTKYPGYLLLAERPVTHNITKRFWITPAFQVQNRYNWERDSVSDSKDHPVFVRRYKTRRDQYAELTRGTTTLSGVWTITVTSPGSGYDPQDPPTVTIGGTGSGATATALVNPDGTIAWIRITAEGTGYTTATVSIEASPGGSNASATATVQSSTCVLIKQSTNNFAEDDPRFNLFLIETRVFQTFPGPILAQWDFQPRFAKYVKIEKQLVLKSTVPVDPNTENVAKNVTIEYQDLTSVYSAKITTTVPTSLLWETTSTDAADIVYEGTMQHRFPDQITEDPIVIVANSLSGSFDYAAAYGWDIKVEEGYSGPCRAVIRERYTADPTTTAFIAALPAATQVFPEGQTVFFREHGTYGSNNANAFARVNTFVVPLTLHPQLNIQVDVKGSLTATLRDVGDPIPATTPTGFNTGDSMLLVSAPERIGIGKIWLVRMITIYHP